MKGAGAGTDGDGMLGLAIGGEFPLERLHFLAQDELAAFQDPDHGGIDLFFDPLILGLQVEIGDHAPAFLMGLFPDVPGQLARYAHHDGMVGHVLGDNGPGPDQRVLADGHATKDDRTAPQGSPGLDGGGDHFPILFGLQAVARGGTGIKVVDEHHPMSNEDPVLQGHPFTKEAMAADLTEFPDLDPFLDLDKGPDLGMVPHFATVKIDQIRVMDGDILTKLDIRRDGHGGPFGRRGWNGKFPFFKEIQWILTKGGGNDKE